MLTIDWEPIDRLLASGLEDLAVLHWEESEIDHQDIPLALDWDRARAFEKAGQMRVAGLRREGELIGYAAFIVMAPMFHQTLLHAFCDAIYVEPAARGPASLGLLVWCETALTKIGVRKVYMSARASTDLAAHDKPARLGSLLTLLGYTLTEWRYCKVLGGDHVRWRHGAHNLHPDRVATG